MTDQPQPHPQPGTPGDPAPGPYGVWQPVPGGGDYDPDQTMHVSFAAQLPPMPEPGTEPLAAPGHGYAPPAGASDFTASGAADYDAVPFGADGTAGGDPATRWSIPAVAGDTPDDSGEYSSGAFAAPWHTGPLSPGGAAAGGLGTFGQTFPPSAFPPGTFVDADGPAAHPGPFGGQFGQGAAAMRAAGAQRGDVHREDAARPGGATRGDGYPGPPEEPGTPARAERWPDPGPAAVPAGPTDIGAPPVVGDDSRVGRWPVDVPVSETGHPAGDEPSGGAFAAHAWPLPTAPAERSDDAAAGYAPEFTVGATGHWDLPFADTGRDDSSGEFPVSAVTEAFLGEAPTEPDGGFGRDPGFGPDQGFGPDHGFGSDHGSDHGFGPDHPHVSAQGPSPDDGSGRADGSDHGGPGTDHEPAPAHTAPGDGDGGGEGFDPDPDAGGATPSPFGTRPDAPSAGPVGEPAEEAGGAPSADPTGVPAGEAVPAAVPEADAQGEADAGSEPAYTHSEHPVTSYVLRVNGTDRPVTDAWLGESLLYVLRERLGLAGAKDGCEQGECGACSVQVDGRLVASCLVPAATAAGTEVRTVEGLSADGRPSDVQRALVDCGAVQCGFCVPGLAMTVHDLLEGNHSPDDLETRQAICGNLCRCSGYSGVLDAVRQVVASRREAVPADKDDAPSGSVRLPHQSGPHGAPAPPPGGSS